MPEQRLRVSVAGRDRTADLGCEVVREAARRRHEWLERQLADEKDVLALKSAPSAAAFQSRHLDVLRSRWMIDTGRFSTPSGPGFLGALVLQARFFLWRIFRYQHDWVSFRQNAVNAQLFYALLFECEERTRQVRELEARVRDLEAQVGTASAAREPRP
jgi:hypothetical protein